MASNAAVVEALRWKKFPVVDNGMVCLVDVMGDECRAKLVRVGILQGHDS